MGIRYRVALLLPDTFAKPQDIVNAIETGQLADCDLGEDPEFIIIEEDTRRDTMEVTEVICARHSSADREDSGGGVGLPGLGGVKSTDVN